MGGIISYGWDIDKWRILRTWGVYIILQNNLKLISLVSYITIILIYNMPKTEIDYSNTIFYKIHCNNPDVKDVYIGHTTNFVQRKHAHKRSCTHEASTNYSCKVYNVIREFGGWNNWKMEIIAFHECDDHYAARKIEQKYFEEYKATLNSIEPFPKPKVTPSKETLPKPEKQILYCETCDIYFSTVTAHDIHNKTNKHIKMVAKNTASENHNITHDKYNCTNCNFKCSKKGDLSRHILTAKHKLFTNVDDKTSKHIKTYSCHCGNEYKYRQSLCVHKKKCTHNNKTNEIQNEIQYDSVNDQTSEASTVLRLLKQNTLLQQNLLEMQTTLNGLLCRLGRPAHNNVSH